MSTFALNFFEKMIFIKFFFNALNKNINIIWVVHGENFSDSSLLNRPFLVLEGDNFKLSICTHDRNHFVLDY